MPGSVLAITEDRCPSVSDQTCALSLCKLVLYMELEGTCKESVRNSCEVKMQRFSVQR